MGKKFFAFTFTIIGGLPSFGDFWGKNRIDRISTCFRFRRPIMILVGPINWTVSSANVPGRPNVIAKYVRT